MVGRWVKWISSGDVKLWSGDNGKMVDLKLILQREAELKLKCIFGQFFFEFIFENVL
jgi:hypothetical protein